MAWSSRRCRLSTLVSLRRLLEVLRPSAVAACAVRTWKFGALFPYGLVPGSLVSRCLGVACGVQGIGSFGRFSGYSPRCLARQWIHVLHQCLALLDDLHTFSKLKWTRSTARTWKTGHYFYELHVAETREDGQHFSLFRAAFFGLLFGIEARRFRVAN